MTKVRRHHLAISEELNPEGMNSYKNIYGRFLPLRITAASA
jgi:hypothetical protein